MQYQCPQCPKIFPKKSSLDAHIKRMHSEPLPATPPATPTAPPATKSKFEVKKPPKKVVEAALYECNACHAELSKGQNPCPNCGEEMNWSGL